MGRCTRGRQIDIRQGVKFRRCQQIPPRIEKKGGLGSDCEAFTHPLREAVWDQIFCTATSHYVTRDITPLCKQHAPPVYYFYNHTLP